MLYSLGSVPGFSNILPSGKVFPSADVSKKICLSSEPHFIPEVPETYFVLTLREFILFYSEGNLVNPSYIWLCLRV